MMQANKQRRRGICKQVSQSVSSLHTSTNLSAAPSHLPTHNKRLSLCSYLSTPAIPHHQLTTQDNFSLSLSVPLFLSFSLSPSLLLAIAATSGRVQGEAETN